MITSVRAVLEMRGADFRLEWSFSRNIPAWSELTEQIIIVSEAVIFFTTANHSTSEISGIVPNNLSPVAVINGHFSAVVVN